MWWGKDKSGNSDVEEGCLEKTDSFLGPFFEVLNQQVGWDFGEIEAFRVWSLKKILLEDSPAFRIGSAIAFIEVVTATSYDTV